MAGVWIVDAPEGSAGFIATVPGENPVDNLLRSFDDTRLHAVECADGVALVDGDNRVIEWLEVEGDEQ